MIRAFLVALLFASSAFAVEPKLQTIVHPSNASIVYLIDVNSIVYAFPSTERIDGKMYFTRILLRNEGMTKEIVLQINCEEVIRQIQSENKVWGIEK